MKASKILASVLLKRFFRGRIEAQKEIEDVLELTRKKIWGAMKKGRVEREDIERILADLKEKVEDAGAKILEEKTEENVRKAADFVVLSVLKLLPSVFPILEEIKRISEEKTLKFNVNDLISLIPKLKKEHRRQCLLLVLDGLGITEKEEEIAKKLIEISKNNIPNFDTFFSVVKKHVPEWIGERNLEILKEELKALWNEIVEEGFVLAAIKVSETSYISLEDFLNMAKNKFGIEISEKRIKEIVEAIESQKMEFLREIRELSRILLALGFDKEQIKRIAEEEAKKFWIEVKKEEIDEVLGLVGPREEIKGYEKKILEFAYTNLGKLEKIDKSKLKDSIKASLAHHEEILFGFETFLPYIIEKFFEELFSIVVSEKIEEMFLNEGFLSYIAGIAVTDVKRAKRVIRRKAEKIGFKISEKDVNTIIERSLELRKEKFLGQVFDKAVRAYVSKGLDGARGLILQEAKKQKISIEEDELSDLIKKVVKEGERKKGKIMIEKIVGRLRAGKSVEMSELEKIRDLNLIPLFLSYWSDEEKEKARRRIIGKAIAQIPEIGKIPTSRMEPANALEWAILETNGKEIREKVERGVRMMKEVVEKEIASGVLDPDVIAKRVVSVLNEIAEFERDELIKVESVLKDYVARRRIEIEKYRRRGRKKRERRIESEVERRVREAIEKLVIMDKEVMIVLLKWLVDKLGSKAFKKGGNQIEVSFVVPQLVQHVNRKVTKRIDSHKLLVVLDRIADAVEGLNFSRHERGKGAKKHVIWIYNPIVVKVLEGVCEKLESGEYRKIKAGG